MYKDTVISELDWKIHSGPVGCWKEQNKNITSNSEPTVYLDLSRPLGQLS